MSDDTNTGGTEQCEMPECDNSNDLKTCSDPENNTLDMCPDCRSAWPVEVVSDLRADGGARSPLAPLDRMQALKWPDCIQCGSDETSVVPKTGEWTCGNCGCQWTSDETPVSNGDEDEIPGAIADGVEYLVRSLQTDIDQSE